MRIEGRTRILELGGGNGALPALMYHRYHPSSYTLTDYDPEEILLARVKLERRFGGLPKSLIVKDADATHLDFSDNTFELVIAHLILHHLGGVYSIFAGLNEISSVLAPGGSFLYNEFVHKKDIRKKIIAVGFTVSYRNGLHRETVLATKPSS